MVIGHKHHFDFHSVTNYSGASATITPSTKDIFAMDDPYQYRFDLVVPGERFGRLFFRTTFLFSDLFFMNSEYPKK